MMGRDDYTHEFVRAVIASKIKQKGDRASIMPSRFRIEDGKYTVTPLELNGSGDIAGCCGCNCFIILKEGVRFVEAGENVLILPLDLRI
jgi:molybdopterin biosynthesis enzyme